MELTVGERLLLLDILPVQGSMVTLRIVRELREALSFDEAEHVTLNLREDGNIVRWDTAQAQDKEIPIGPKAMDLIRTRIKELSEDNALRLDHLPLCDKFEVT